jgi:hypothetical protein
LNPSGGRPRRAPAVALAVAAAVGTLGCDVAPLGGKSCPCAAGYTCCVAEQLCLPQGQICASAFVWPPATAPTATPLPLDAIVFAMSEYDVGTADPQVLELAPDVVVRGWSTWDQDGFLVDKYDTAYLEACHQANIRFIGGANLAALFTDQFPDQWDAADTFTDFATRDPRDQTVSHDGIYPKLSWASLANPRVRARAVQIAEMQIDLGVDGLQFVSLESDVEAVQVDGVDGRDGYDDYHLADFNAYLLAKYPSETDFATRFSMMPPNVLERDRAPGDLSGNFNYRTYLHDLGVSDDPSSSNNPLAGEWGVVNGGRAAIGPQTFLETAGDYVYWRQIVAELHAYAQARGHDVFINATGVYPFVDFQAVGLFDNTIDAPNGETATYVPVDAGGRLDGTVSLAPAFAGLRARAQALSPGAPVVVFLDGDWPQYDGLTASELQDYWRLYTAEAYASGLFFAFDLYSPGDPQHTATGTGLMQLYQGLAAFYRAHAGLYRGVVASTEQSSDLPAATVTLADQPDPANAGRISRRIVHVVNHQYEGGIVTRTGIPLAVSSSAAPVAVALASPDETADAPLPFSYAGGQIALTLPSLAAYDVVVIDY